MTYPWNAGDILTAADLNAEFGSKLNLAGGKILQIVRATDTTNRSITSATYVDVTGMSVTITPQRSDSAVLLLAYFVAQNSQNTADISFFRITDSSNNAISGAEETYFGLFRVSFSSTPADISAPLSLNAYATPATTSAVTYKLRCRCNAGTTIIFNGASRGQMYAIEVSA
jgi:hypothetical protein